MLKVSCAAYVLAPTEAFKGQVKELVSLGSRFGVFARSHFPTLSVLLFFRCSAAGNGNKTRQTNQSAKLENNGLPQQSVVQSCSMCQASRSKREG